MNAVLLIVIGAGLFWLMTRAAVIPAEAIQPPGADQRIYQSPPATYYIDRTFNLATLFIWAVLLFLGVKALGSLRKLGSDLD